MVNRSCERPRTFALVRRRLRVWSLLCVLACAALAVSLGGCAKRAAPTRVVVGVSALRISLPIFVAQSRGLFARHGLTVELKPFETAQPLADEVSDGRIDAGGYVAWPILFLSARRGAQPPQAATSIVEDAGHRLSYVLARRGSGLQFPRDVRGRRVGILPTVAYRKWLDAMLTASGVRADEVSVVPVAPPLQSQTLASGGVDLLFTNDPMATAMLGAGVAEVADPDPSCPRILGTPFRFGTFALSSRFVRARPDVARRLVDALDEAIALVRADQASARRAMAPFVRPQERAWVDRYPDASFLTSRETTAAMFEDEAAREVRLGILTEAPRVTPWRPDAR